MPAALPWPPAQVELIQPIQKETFPNTVLAFRGDGRKAAESGHMSSVIKLPRKI